MATRENHLHRIWRANRVALNAWLTIPCAWTGELLSHAGFDALTIDLQHGLADYHTAVSMLQAVSAKGRAALVRVPWNEPIHIMKLLDAGAFGVIAPMINSRSDAESFVGACRYPPAGFRSYGPIRAKLYAGGDYLRDANDFIIAIAMIETAEALDNLDSILETEGLSGLYIGTVDLSISLGLSTLGDLQDPVLRSSVARILSSAERRNRIVGAHAASAEEAGMLADWGVKLITPVNDSTMLLAAAKDIVERTRANLK